MLGSQQARCKSRIGREAGKSGRRSAGAAGWRRGLGSLLSAAIGAVILGGGVFAAAPALAAPDPDLYPNVVEVPAVSATFTGPGMLSTISMSLPVGAVPAGTAKVLHGEVLNASTEPLCIFSSGRGGGFLVPSSTSAGAGLQILESDGFPTPLADMLPATGAAALVRGLPVVQSTGSDWLCDFGTLLSPGATLEFTITVGVPVGGTAITSSTLALRAYVEAAQAPSDTWSDDLFFASALLNNTSNPLTINASQPSTDWGLAAGVGSGTAWPGRALGAYGVFTNDFDVPISVAYAGFDATGALARFIQSALNGWPDAVTLQPGESTDTFLMMLGSPEIVGNESLQTQMTFAFTWAVTTPSVTFDANGGTGTMQPQTATEPTPLTPNAFTRDGYTFTGWNTEPDGSGTPYADRAVFAFQSDTTMYAQWTPVATATPAPTTPVDRGESKLVTSGPEGIPSLVASSLLCLIAASGLLFAARRRNRRA